MTRYFSRNTQRRWFKRGTGAGLMLILLASASCMWSPVNGLVDSSANVVGRSFTYTGYYTAPSIPIEVQVLKDANADPYNNGNWTFLASTKSKTTPIYINDPTPLYEWTVSAIPVPNENCRYRWPQGGLLRLRAIAKNPDGSTVVLVVFDDDFLPCLKANPNASWQTIGLRCGNPYKGSIVVIALIGLFCGMTGGWWQSL